MTELSFEQEQDITAIIELYRSNPSNSNKYRFDLFAYINKLLNPSEDTAYNLRYRVEKDNHDRI